MHKGFLKTAALLGCISVALGAFAAHGLKDMISLRAIGIFETAVRYQFYHVFAIFIVAILYKDFSQRLLTYAGWLFIAGIVLFSGSLYALTAVEGMVKPGYGWIGIITPFGGLAFIGGWLMILFSIIRKK